LPTKSETPSKRNHFRGVTPFTVQFNFVIPLFEGNIDANALEKWLTLLEGYCSIKNNSGIEKITFSLLKALPHVKYWWESYWDSHEEDEFTTFMI
jgi:hypothetical protein